MESNTVIEIPEYNLKELYPNTKMLSSSQVLKYAESPADFYTEYVLGVKRPPSVPMLIGSIFSALHEFRDFPAREALLQVKAPKRIGDLFEDVIRHFPVVPSEVALIADHKGWQFRATLDGFVEEEYIIIENKTGQVEWTQERTNFSDQITFQSWCHLKKYNVLPLKILLNWVNTAPQARKTLTTYKTSRTMKNLVRFENSVIDLVIDGIEAENWTKPIYNF